MFSRRVRMFEQDIQKIVLSLMNKQPIACLLNRFYGNPDFEKELFSAADKYLYRNIKGQNTDFITPYERAYITLALTVIAQSYYDGGNFYDPVRQNFQLCYNGDEDKWIKPYSDVTIQKHIRKILSFYIQWCSYFNDSDYVAVPLTLGVVPHSRLRDLFDVGMSIYKSYFLHEEMSDDEIYSQVEKAYLNLKKRHLVGESDSLGTYWKMSKYTQSSIASGAFFNDLVQITADVVKIIIQHMATDGDSLNEEDVPPFYQSAYQEWKDEKETIQEKDEKKGKIIVSRPFFSFSYSDNEIYLTTGAFKVDDETIDPNNIEVVIGNERIPVKDVDSARDDHLFGGGFQINQIKISLTKLGINPINECSYQIVCADNVLHDSRDKCFREYLIFNQDGKEIKPSTQYDGYAIFVNKNGVENEDQKILYSKNGYTVSSIRVNETDPFIIDGKHIVFSRARETKESATQTTWLMFEPNEITGINENIRVFSSYDGIIFDSSCKPSDIRVFDKSILNSSKDIELKTIRVETISQGINRINKYFIQINGLSDGFHYLELRNQKNENILNRTFKFVLCSKATKTYDDGILSVDSTFLSEKIQNIKDNLDIKKKCFVPGLGYGLLHINPQVMFYSLDDGITWCETSDRIDFINVKTLANKTICIRGPKDLKVGFLNKEGLLVGLEKNSFDEFGWINKYYLSQMQSCMSQMHAALHLKSKYVNDEIIYVDFAPNVDDECSKREINGRNASFVFVYSGEVKVEARLTKYGESVSLKQEITSGIPFEFKELTPFVTYNLTLHKKAGLVGFDNTPFYSSNVYISDPRCLVGKRFSIKQVECVGLKHGGGEDIKEISTSHSDFRVTLEAFDRSPFDEEVALGYEEYFSNGEPDKHLTYFGIITVKEEFGPVIKYKCQFYILNCVKRKEFWAIVRQQVIERDEKTNAVEIYHDPLSFRESRYGQTITKQQKLEIGNGNGVYEIEKILIELV